MAREALDYRQSLVLVRGELREIWHQEIGGAAANEHHLALDVLQMMGDASWVVSSSTILWRWLTFHFLCYNCLVAQVDRIQLSMGILIHAPDELVNGRSRVYQASIQGVVRQRSGAHTVGGEQLDALSLEDSGKSLSGIPRGKGEQGLSGSVAALCAGNDVVVIELSWLVTKRELSITHQHAFTIEDHGDVRSRDLLRSEMLASWLDSYGSIVKFHQFRFGGGCVTLVS
jgi:hypothetical protein